MLLIQIITFLAGTAMNFITLGSSVVTQQRFYSNRAFATAVVMLGYTVGNILAPFWVTNLISTFGWRGALLGHGSLVLHGCIFVMFLSTPKEFQCTEKFTWKTYLEDIMDFRLLRKWDFLLYAIVTMLHKFASAGFRFQLAGRAVHLGLSMTQGAICLMSLSAAQGLCRAGLIILFKFVSPNRTVVFTGSSFAMAIASVGMAVSHTYTSIIICSIVFGISLCKFIRYTIVDYPGTTGN